MVSAALYSVRVGNAYARLVRKSIPWGMRYSAFTGSGFHIVTRGTVWLITTTDEPVALAPGDLVLVAAGADHGLSHRPVALDDLPVDPLSADDDGPGPADAEFLCGAYRLGHGAVHLYLKALPGVIVLRADPDRHAQFRFLVDLLSADVSDSGLSTQVQRRALIDLVLAHLLQRWEEQAVSAGWPSVDDPAVSAALRTIHGDPQRRWSVQQLSRTAGLSRSVFSRRFTTVVGTPPTAYMVSHRLAHSARLLQETSQSLATIARQVGYSTEFAFSAAFHREYGISPGRFRGPAQRQP